MPRITRLSPLAALFLFACEPAGVTGPVDVSKLPPLSGQEIALMTAGEAAAQRGNFAQAERNYLDAVAKSQGRVEAHVALANFYLSSKEREKAKEVLERASALQPQHPKVAYMLGKIYLTEGKVDQAIATFNKSLELYPTDLDLLTAAGIAYDMKPQHATAQGLYQRAMSMNPKSDLTMLRTNLAMSYILTGKSAVAVDMLKADAAKPNASDVTRQNLALAYDMLGKAKEADTVLKPGELSAAERAANVKRIQEYVAAKRGL